MTGDFQRLRTPEGLEDEEDRGIALARLAENLPSILLDEVVKQLGLDGSSQAP
jgi:hypothetical protein